MTTTVNKTNGDFLTSIPEEGKDDSTTPLVLLGRNYREGYSKPVAENFVRLMENFRGSAAPVQAVEGQLWYNSDSNTLNVNVGGDGTSQRFVPVGLSLYASWDAAIINGQNVMCLIVRDINDNELKISAIYSLADIDGPLSFTIPAPPAASGLPKAFIAEELTEVAANEKLLMFNKEFQGAGTTNEPGIKPGLNISGDINNVINMGGNLIENVQNPTDSVTSQSSLSSNVNNLTKPKEAVNRESLQRGLDTKLDLAGTNGITGPVTGNIDMNNTSYLVNLPAPTIPFTTQSDFASDFDLSSDPEALYSVNKAYVDNRIQDAYDASAVYTQTSSVTSILSDDPDEISVVGGTTPTPRIGLPQRVRIQSGLIIDNQGKGPIPGTTVDAGLKLNGPGLHARIQLGGSQALVGGDGTNGGNGSSLKLETGTANGQVLLSGETIVLAENGNVGGLNVFSGNSYPNIQLNGNGAQARITFGNQQVIYGGFNLDLSADTPGGSFLSNAVVLSTGDYGEYFESQSGEKIPTGTTVVLKDNKLVSATDDDGESIIGVIRAPGTSTVGNAAWDGWKGKYLRDEWGEIQIETKTKWQWFETDGDGMTLPKSTTIESQAPDYAEKIEYQEPMLNPEYDPNLEYIPRSERPEWNIVGLVGQVLIRKGQPVNPRWIKMRNISDTIEEWFIR